MKNFKIKWWYFLCVYVIALLAAGGELILSAGWLFTLQGVCYFPSGLFSRGYVLFSGEYGWGIRGIILTLCGYVVYVLFYMFWWRYKRSFIFALFLLALVMNVVGCRIQHHSFGGCF